MHPFLKHKMLSRSMRELMRSSSHHGRKRHKRYDNAINNNSQVGALVNDVMKEMAAIGCHKTVKTIDVECRINGSWTSEQAGRVIDIGDLDATEKKKAVRIRAPLKKHGTLTGFMARLPWNATLVIPFPKSPNYMILTALDRRNKMVATFMGECRVCRHKEMIQGQWLLTHHARDCESLGATAQVIGDVWRRDHLQTLKKERLQMLHNKMLTMESDDGVKTEAPNVTTKSSS